MKEVTDLAQYSQPKSILWEIAREGAREMIQRALIYEQEEFLRQHEDLLTEAGKQRLVKNGYQRQRTVQLPGGCIEIKAPRIRDRGQGKKIEFHSKILPKYLRRSTDLDEFIPFLYLKGISTNDFSEVLSNLLGQQITISPASIVRLKSSWISELEEWQKRDLSGKKYIYIWVDGVYFNSRMDGDKTCVLVAIGATDTGKKELLAIQAGFRESEISWKELLKDLKRRGLDSAPKLAIGDGALGFWKALKQEWPETLHQRCWVHKTANVLDKLPKSVQPSAKEKIHDIYLADTKENALKAFNDFVEIYGDKYPRATDCLIQSKSETLAFYDFPAEQWTHIRSTNPIESTFATVKLRTYKTKGCGTQKETLAMAFKLILSAEKSWRRLRGYNKIPLVLAGQKFKNGELVEAA